MGRVMATQGQGAATSPPANVVGNAFVSQYYNVLHVSPQVVHRFYTDASCLTRAEAGPEGPAETLISQGEIHNKIVSLDFEGCKSEIKTVDSQKSLSGSVLVMVTGAIYKNGGKRNFSQTFFLAPQEKGFYVHNDIFRYLDEEIPQLPQAIADVSVEDNNIQEAQIEHEVRDLSPPTPIEEEPIVENTFEVVESTNPPQQVEVVILEEVVDLDAVDELLPMEVVPEVPAAPVEEMPAEKKSYASIVRVASSNNTRPPVTKAAATITHSVPPPPPPTSEQPGISRSMPPPAIEAPTAADSDAQNESKIMEQEADGRSVYVRNLPTDILADQLKDVFMKFGTIRPNGVQVRSNKLGGCYGFVEFEDTNSAHSAIEVSPIMIGGRPAFIEEKRSTTVVSGRGRGGLQGRGGGAFRNDTGRGRAFYGRGGGQDYGRGGGRGYARGASQDYGRGGSRGGFARGAGQEYGRGRGGYRGGAYGKFGSNSNSNGAESYRRTDAYSGNGTPS